MARKSKAQKQGVFEFGNEEAWMRLSRASKTGQWVRLEWGADGEAHSVILRARSARNFAELVLRCKHWEFNLPGLKLPGVHAVWCFYMPLQDGRYIRIEGTPQRVWALREFYASLYPSINPAWR